MVVIRVPWLPSLKRNWVTHAITIAPVVFVLSRLAHDEALMAHERKHIEQVRATGWWKWYWRYVFDREYRRQQEAEGYAVQRAVKSAIDKA